MSRKKETSDETSPPRCCRVEWPSQSSTNQSNPLGRARREDQDDCKPSSPQISSSTTEDYNHDIQYSYDPGDFLRTSARLMLQEAPLLSSSSSTDRLLPQKPALAHFRSVAHQERTTTSINKYPSNLISISSLFYDKLQPEIGNKKKAPSSSSSSSPNSSKMNIVPMIHSTTWNTSNEKNDHGSDCAGLAVSHSMMGDYKEPILRIASWPTLEDKERSAALARHPTMTNDPTGLVQPMALDDSFLQSLSTNTSDKDASSSSSVTMEEINFKRRMFQLFFATQKQNNNANEDIDDDDDDFHARIQKLKPLNAYNYFFRDERDNLVSQRNQNRGAGQKQSPPSQDSSAATVPTTAAATTTTTTTPVDRSESKKWKLLYQRWCQDPCKPKRKHRKIQEETLPFVTLGREIADRWKALSSKGKEFYYDIAKMDEELYKYMIARYNEQQKKKKAARRDPTTP